MKCRKCGKEFEPIHDKDVYCEECQSDYVNEDISLWEQEMNYGSSPYLDDLIEEEDEDE